MSSEQSWMSHSKHNRSFQGRVYITLFTNMQISYKKQHGIGRLVMKLSVIVNITRKMLL